MLSLFGEAGNPWFSILAHHRICRNAMTRPRSWSAIILDETEVATKTSHKAWAYANCSCHELRGEVISSRMLKFKFLSIWYHSVVHRTDRSFFALKRCTRCDSDCAVEVSIWYDFFFRVSIVKNVLNPMANMIMQTNQPMGQIVYSNTCIPRPLLSESKTWSATPVLYSAQRAHCSLEQKTISPKLRLVTLVLPNVLMIQR